MPRQLKHFKVRVLIPYGRVVEFRKFCQTHPHIVWQSRPKEWIGRIGARVHARAHDVYLTQEKFAAWLKLTWAVME